MIKYFIAILLGFVGIINAQEIKEYEPSIIPLAKGFGQLSMENYANAIDHMKEISPSDTNYIIAQFQKGICEYELDRFKDASISFQNLYKNDSKLKELGYYWDIKSLIQLKEFEQAETLIAKAQKLFPLYFRFDLIKGELLTKKKLFNEAIQHYQTYIQKNPEHADGHYELAKLCADNGDLVRALLGYNAALLADIQTSKRNSIYTDIEDIYNNNYAIIRKDGKKDDLFKQIESLIKSQVAINQDYKSKLPIGYPLIKGNDMLFSQFSYKSDTKDFWMDFYGKYYDDIKKQNLIPALQLYQINMLNNPNVQKLIAGQYKKDLKVFEERNTKHWRTMQQEAHFEIRGKKYENPYWYNSDGTMYGVGIQENNELRGTWTFFYPNGQIKSVINYNNKEELTGFCIWYDQAGNTIQQGNYKDGVLEGEAFFSYDSGQKWYSSDFKNGELNGATNLYNKNGLLSESFVYQDGKKNGEWKEYSYTGEVLNSCNYNDGKREGDYIGLFNGGMKYLEVKYEKGKATGAFKKYYKDGVLQEEGFYKNGNPEGIWKTYFTNGQVKTLYTLKSGLIEGKYYEFYVNGNTSRIANFKAGLLHGTDVNYDFKRNVLSSFIYKKGKLKSFQYFKPDGTIASSGKKRVIGYDGFGFKLFEGALKKGERIGVYRYYWKNGIVESERPYVNGELEGLYKWFYNNGKLKGKVFYKAGEMHGYYESFYENGQVKSSGWYVNGVQTGDWKFYQIDGTIDQEEYYINGKQDRYLHEYNENGKKHATSFYVDEVLQFVEFYDTNEVVIDRVEFNLGSGPYKAKAITGYNFIDGTMKNGEKDGVFKFLFPNGKPFSETNYKVGFRNGTYKKYHTNGKIREEGEYFYGYKHGEWKEYFDDGKLYWKANFNYGEIVDSSVTYNYSGTPSIISYYDKDGELIRKKYFHKDNQISSDVPYTFGYKNGTYETYDNKGNVMYKRTYQGDELMSYTYLKDGKYVPEIQVKLNDKLTAYYNNGNVSFDFGIKNKVFDGPYKKYYESGQIWQEGTYVNDQLDSTYTVYFENGKVDYKENYKNGVLHGESINYWDNGNIESEKSYYKGELNGVCKYYSQKGKLISTVTYYQGNVIEIK